MSRYANILFDNTFKVVVCAPGNEGLLIKNIELLIPGKRIKSLILRDKENHGLSISDKNSIFDMFCTSEDGEQFIVEMQHAPQKNYADRMLCYATYPIRNQLAKKFAKRHEKVERGEPVDKMDYGLFPVYVVSILNFSIKHECEDALEEGLVSRYEILNTHNGEQMTKSLQFVYLELDRLKAAFGEDYKCKTLLERFAYSTKYMHVLDNCPDGFEDDLLKEYFAATEYANWSIDKQTKYDEAMRTELDIIAEKAYVREEGIAEGIEKTIMDFKRAGATDELIAKATGLSLEQIATLK